LVGSPEESEPIPQGVAADFAAQDCARLRILH
jgi:hypothetical protein